MIGPWPVVVARAKSQHPMRPPPMTSALARMALAAAIAMVACTKHPSTAGADDAGDDAGDASSFDAGPLFGDDSAILEGDDSSSPGDAATGDCAVPDGTYLVTMTPAGDAGGGSGCVATSSTVTFPLSGACNVTPDGMLPVCTVDFSCTQNTGSSTSTTTEGYVQVYNGSYVGYETVQVVSTMVGMPTLSTCAYNTTYTAM